MWAILTTADGSVYDAPLGRRMTAVVSELAVRLPSFRARDLGIYFFSRPDTQATKKHAGGANSIWTLASFP